MAIADQAVTAGLLLSFVAVASDPDVGQHLAFSLSAPNPCRGDDRREDRRLLLHAGPERDRYL